MDFEQFLAEGPMGALLGLMVLPVLGVLIIGVFLVFSFSRRNKKSKMKLGLQQNQADMPPAEAALPQTPLPQKNTSRSESSGFNLNMSPKNAENMVPQKSLNKQKPLTGQTLDPEEEKSMANKQDKLTLAARLAMSTAKDDLPASDSPSTPTVAPPQQAPVETAQAAQPVELLRLLRNPQTGQLVVEVAGKQYTKLAEITDKKIGQYILILTAHLLAFTNGVIVTQVGIKSFNVPKIGDVPEPIGKPEPAPHPIAAVPTEPSPLIPPPPPEAQAKFLASLQTAQIKNEPISTPKKSGFFGIGGGKSSPTAGEKLLGLNLAAEINEIVQTRLRYSPLAGTTKIDIQSEPSGGLRIIVNDKIYASPDDVAPPEVKELIKASIKDWEHS